MMKCLSAAILIWITEHIEMEDNAQFDILETTKFEVSIVSTVADDWGYADESDWGGLCKIGAQQSPINLVYSEAEPQVFSAFHFHNYNVYNNATITNNGHSVAIEMDGPLCKISGGGLLGDYILNHFHFHWRSEHTVDGERFPLEMHLVHFSSKYSSIQEAVKDVEGVAVLGILFHQSLDHDEEFIPLIKAIEEVLRDHNTKAAFTKTIAARDFLPRDTADYYRYMGSLTTPTCNEGVIWTVFTKTLPISADQLNHFESVALKDGPRTLNYRQIQPLNGRTVSLRSSPTRIRNLSPPAISTSLETVLIFTMLIFIRNKLF